MSKKTPVKAPVTKGPAKPAVNKATAKPAVTKATASKPESVTPVQVKPTPPPAPKEVDLKTAVKLVFDKSDQELNAMNKWAVLVDEAERCGAFFRHRDTRYVSCYDKSDLGTDKLRLSILSAYFYGTILVIDIMDNLNLLDLFKEACNNISNNLFEDIIDKTIVTNENRYKDLIRDSDGEGYLEWKIRNNGGFGVCFLTTKQEVAAIMPYAVPYIVQ